MRLSLDAAPREAMTKGQVGRLRKEGKTLLSLSEAGKETKHFTVDEKTAQVLLNKGGPSVMIELKSGSGRAALSMPRQVQRDPISHKILNIGLMAISSRKPITAPVSVRLHGEPQPVKEGIGVLDQEAQTVEVRALPDKMPAHIDVDVSALELQGKVFVSDLAPSTEYEVVSPADTILAVVHIVRAAVAEEAAAEEEAASGEEAAPASESAADEESQ